MPRHFLNFRCSHAMKTSFRCVLARKYKSGRLAQLVERVLDVYEAIGSSPIPPTSIKLSDFFPTNSAAQRAASYGKMGFQTVRKLQLCTLNFEQKSDKIKITCLILSSLCSNNTIKINYNFFLPTFRT